MSSIPSAFEQVSAFEGDTHELIGSNQSISAGDVSELVPESDSCAHNSNASSSSSSSSASDESIDAVSSSLLSLSLTQSTPKRKHPAHKHNLQ